MKIQSVFCESPACSGKYLLTYLLDVTPKERQRLAALKTDRALRYLRDRVNVPRDMSIFAGKFLRQSLEQAAQLVGSGRGEEIRVRDRRDQNPRPFVRA